MKNIILVGPKNEKICGLKLMLNQRTQWCDYIEEVMNITNGNKNKNSYSSAYLNKSRFPFWIYDISLPQDQTRSVYFLTSQKDTSYVQIGSTLCLRTTIIKYNAVGHTSGTDSTMHFSMFVFIAYIYVLERTGKW